MTNEIEFFCVRPDHQTRALRESLTIHDEKWAYCPADQVDGHAWQPYAQMTLGDLQRLRQARDTPPTDWMRDR